MSDKAYQYSGIISHKAGISSNALKMIAICSMLIDHIGAVVIETGIFGGPEFTHLAEILATEQGARWYLADTVLRLIGRIAFPIFCFLLVEGFMHTRNVRKYAARLFLFAVVSEIPFDLAIFGTLFSTRHQNVYFTLLIGLLVLAGMERFRDKTLKQLLVVLSGFFAAYVLKSDYDVIGVMLILLLYLLRCDKKKRTVYGCILAAAESIDYFGAAALAFIPINLYNGKKGGMRIQYLFYWFYPLHLMLLYIIRRLIF